MIPMEMHGGMYGGMLPSTASMEWSLECYRKSVALEEKAQSWDELEKSILGKLADGVLVGQRLGAEALAAICEASDRITEFCENNEMAAKQIMRISLSIKEILTVIAQKNPGAIIDFDIKAFSLQGVMGIRIRDGGITYNPMCVEASEEDADFYMGIRIIEKMAEEIVCQSTFGTNSLQIFV